MNGRPGNMCVRILERGKPMSGEYLGGRLWEWGLLGGYGGWDPERGHDRWPLVNTLQALEGM